MKYFIPKYLIPVIIAAVTMAAISQLWEVAVIAGIVYMAACVLSSGGVFPVVEWKEQPSGRNARNTPFYIEIDPSAKNKLAILAQEIWEAQYKVNFISLLLLRLSTKKQQSLEIMGHEIEVQAACIIYGVHEENYRRREAETMAHSYSQFRQRMNPTEIEAAMKKKAVSAHQWVRSNMDLIMSKGKK